MGNSCCFEGRLTGFYLVWFGLELKQSCKSLEITRITRFYLVWFDLELRPRRGWALAIALKVGLPVFT